MHCLFLGWRRHLAAIEVHVLIHHELVPLVGGHAQHLLPGRHVSLVLKVPAHRLLLTTKESYTLHRASRGVEGGIYDPKEPTLPGLRLASAV